MRLATYNTVEHSEPRFGLVLDETIVAMSALQREAGTSHEVLASMHTFVATPGAAQEAAEALLDQVPGLIADPTLAAPDCIPLSEARLLPPLLPPAALLDFALTPRHLYNAAQTMVTHEFSGLKRFIARRVVRGRIDRAGQSREYPYYIGNHHAVIGHDDATTWPPYTSYLDIEPELAAVTGPPDHPIAGYTILNDLSARDVQMPELDTFSLTRSKHFDRGNGLGPFLVTPDEVGDPRSLDVEVQFADRDTWHGSTSEYVISPDEALEYLRSIFPPAPGTVVGLGTIPGCCGLDRDQWLLPGDSVDITFARLGTLRQHIPAPPPPRPLPMAFPRRPPRVLQRVTTHAGHLTW